MAQTVTYNRLAAARYALRHYNNPNPQYANMDTMGAGGDCTNFTSQCLLAGGFQMDYRHSSYDREWWYRRRSEQPFDGDSTDWWSCTWSLAQSSFLYFAHNQGLAFDLTENPRMVFRLKLGDLIFYDWNGRDHFGHSALVTGRTRRLRVPLVTFRTLQPLRPLRNGHWTLRSRRQASRIVGLALPDRLQVFEEPPDFTRLVPCDRTRRSST